MTLLEAIRIALHGLHAHRLRSTLTMLGLTIGVASVVLLTAIGNGLLASVNARIQPITNLLIIVPTIGNIPGGGSPKNLTDADVAALQNPAQAPDVATATPAVTGEALVEGPTAKSRTTIIGSTENYMTINNRDVQAGSFFDEAQVRSTARVVVLGPTAVDNLFDRDPMAALHQTVWISHQSFKVIGVQRPVGQQNDNVAIMPLTTARRYIFGGGDTVNQILVQATQTTAVPAAEDEVIRILSDRHRIKDPENRDFEVQSMRNRLNIFTQLLRILTLFTAAVATISLFVGGVGILNIMLVSVAERTREIGIRRAIGATRRAIFKQFIIESTILAGLGGVMGIVVGVGLSVLGAAIAPPLDPTLGPPLPTLAPIVSIVSVVISFMLSLVIGLIAGTYPANRAARLQPIEALRH